ncbi:hypothetical protein QOZ80_4AG0314540 [Eleusine coracana subsp. coracana]|nr:hypothetical protein QOZ80_4AG0314540 [Eleusine coracana subsp. coracana]
MASSSSRQQVTITLGRSGQVVKRRAISDFGNDGEVPFSGKKRSMRERLGSNVADSDFIESQQRNKRRQTESKSSYGDDDCQVGEDDLRLKLMRKGLIQRSNGGIEQNGGDLREKLSRNRKKIPRHDPRGHVPESRARYDMRDDVPEPRPRYSSREGVPGSRTSAIVASLVPSARSMDELIQLDSSRNRYSSWVSDGSRHRSPEMPRRVRGDTSPPRAYEQIRSMSSLRPLGSSRAPSHTARDAPETLRSQPYGKSTISVDTVPRANGITSSSPAVPTAPVMTEASQTVTGLLNALGLEKYAVLFQAEEVDMAALRQMGESDLKDMGVPMGPRKKILLALGSNTKQRQK